MQSLVVMGVSGCGKSHVGAALARRLGLPQFEAFEPPLGEAGVLRLDALQPPQLLVERTAHWLAGQSLAD